MSKALSKIGKQTPIYLAGVIANRATGFVMLPIYTSYPLRRRPSPQHWASCSSSPRPVWPTGVYSRPKLEMPSVVSLWGFTATCGEGPPGDDGTGPFDRVLLGKASIGCPGFGIEVEMVMEVLQSLGRRPVTLTDLSPVSYVVDID